MENLHHPREKYVISTHLWISLVEKEGQIIISRQNISRFAFSFYPSRSKKEKKERKKIFISKNVISGARSPTTTPRLRQREIEREKKRERERERERAKAPSSPDLFPTYLRNVGWQYNFRREKRVIASNPWRKALNPADWPRVFICMRGFRLLYELTVERHIRHGRRFAFQPVSEKAIVNDRWTSNGATRVAYNRA